MRGITHASGWPQRIVVGASVVVVGYLVVVPLAYLLWESLHLQRAGAGAPAMSLDNFLAVYARAGSGRLVVDSLRFAIGSALIAFTTGTVLAWMNERTNVPFKRVFFALSIVPLIVPGVLFVIAWMLLGSPKIGLINVALQTLFRTDHVFVDVYSLSGMAFVDGLHYAPLAFLMMSAAFRATDPALEEAALMSGASILSVAWRVTLRLSWPAAFAALLMLFVRALESFEAPALLGLPAGIQVFTSAIYAVVHRYPADMGLASAYGVVLLAIAATGLALQSRLAARASHQATVTGRGFRPHRIDLGRWRIPAAVLFIAYVLLIVGLPFLVLLWSSLQKFYAAPSVDALHTLTFAAYRSVLGYPSIARATVNSIVLAVLAATLIMVVTSVICWIVIKSNARGRAALDIASSLPVALPGIVLGLALMIFYLYIDVGIYGTLWILLVAYVTRFLPYGIRYNSASMLAIHRELEESAAMSGASWWQTFRRITLPLLRPGLVAGWIYIAIVSIRELSSSILLYGPDTEVLSVVIWELWENGQYVELSALGVLMIVALSLLVFIAQRIGGRLGYAIA
ncbi:MAG TPA: iron ABC transporter permease [Casimicrobiaceae bacterium]|nr:iron ABC transporter permease [Casimicrobiaceae bacterium]